MKPFAYIHIGLEKTGTTSLQEFFFLNKQNLAKDNIHLMSSPGARNHTDLAAYAYDKTLGDLIVQKNIQTTEAKEAFREEFLERFTREIQTVKKTKAHLLVSSEHLSSRVFSKNEIRKLIGLFTKEGYQPKIIVYLRRQDQYLLSTYSTWLKSGATAELNQKAYKRKRYDYLSLLELWGEVVGDKNLTVKIFERARMYKNDLIEDFMQILGITETSNYQQPASDLNKSLDKNKLLFLQSINSLVPSVVNGQSNPLRGELVKALEQMDNSNKLSLDPKLSQTILDYYKADNVAIKEKYFPQHIGSLFNETIKTNAADADKSSALTIEELYQITSALWNHQQTEINDLTIKCNKQQAKIDEYARTNEAIEE